MLPFRGFSNHANTPTVSIIIPLFNEERYISKCLDSILSNDYPQDRLEILLIDGMSTDRSREIVQDYIKRFPFIRLLENPKRIQAAALNIGLQEAMGEIIIRMDAHTLYAPDYISRCVELLEMMEAANVGGLQRAVGPPIGGLLPSGHSTGIRFFFGGNSSPRLHTGNFI